MHVVSIDKQAINELPRVNFAGHIHVIDAISQVKSAVTALRTSPIVGFDTETRPCFHRGERHNIALLQLSTQHDAFLFRVNKTGVPEPLKRFLEDKTVIKIGLSTTDDFHQLSRVCDCQPAGFIELQKLVKEYQITDMSLQKIYAITLELGSAPTHRGAAAIRSHRRMGMPANLQPPDGRQLHPPRVTLLARTRRARLTSIQKNHPIQLFFEKKQQT